MLNFKGEQIGDNAANSLNVSSWKKTGQYKGGGVNGKCREIQDSRGEIKKSMQF